MKIAVISDEVARGIFYKDGLVGLIDAFREYGLTGIEIRSLFPHTGPQLLTDQEVGVIADAAKSKDLGFQVPAIASPVFKCPFPEDQSAMDEQLKNLARCIEIAQRLEAGIIRVFAFSLGSVDLDDSSDWAKIVQAFARPAEMAAEAGITLGIENEHTTSINSVHALVDLLREINHPNIKAVYDPANDVWAGHRFSMATAVDELHIYRTLDKLFPYLAHVHVKDALPATSEFPSYSPPVGLGVVPWSKIIRHLTEKGYDGWWSIETHYRLEALTKAQVDRPGGEEYTKGGYEATLICVHNFLELVRQVGAR